RVFSFKVLDPITEKSSASAGNNSANDCFMVIPCSTCVTWYFLIRRSANLLLVTSSPPFWRKV
ncbi:MAG: hypothetical protein WCB17_00205, partial [Dehalococcoidales bacterium]